MCHPPRHADHVRPRQPAKADERGKQYGPVSRAAAASESGCAMTQATSQENRE